LVHEGIAHPELALHPQLAHQGALRYERLNALEIAGSLGLGVALIIAPENSHLLRSQAVEKEGGMGGDQELGLGDGAAALLSEFRQQARMEEVLRLLDADEGRGGKQR
jgi:hypothetical protein